MTTPGNELVRTGPSVPAELATLGVKVNQTPDGKYRTIEFPDALKEKFNILLPTEELVQQLPDYTPSFRVVRLNPLVDKGHFYKPSGGRGGIAPTKQALEALADGAFLQSARARPLTRLEVSAWPEGSLGYEATVVIRRSDGTPYPITRTKIWNREVERAKVEATAKDAADFRRKFLIECEQAPAKTESKAVLRAIRAALQVPHTFTEAEAKKPFLVVGYAFTPDLSDPETRKVILEIGYARGAEVYGGAAPALEAAEAEREPSRAEAPVVEGTGAAAAVSEPPAAAAESLFDGQAPSVAAEDAGEGEVQPSAEYLAALEYVLPEGFSAAGESAAMYAGKPLQVVVDAADDTFLAWLASDQVKHEPTNEAARVLLEHGVPA